MYLKKFFANIDYMKTELRTETETLFAAKMTIKQGGFNCTFFAE